MQAAGYEVEVVLTRDGAVVRPVRKRDGDEQSPTTDSEDDYLII